MKKRTIKKVCASTIANCARKITSIDVNTACPYIGYQPTLPETAKKMRKF